MRNGIDRSFLTRLLRTTAFSLALMTASAAGVHAETVIVQGAGGADGANRFNGSGGDGKRGRDASAIANSKTDSSNAATASGGDGGNGGNGGAGERGGFGGGGGKGGNGSAIAVTRHAGSASATATGGNGGNGGDSAFFAGGSGGDGGGANAKSTAIGAGSASVTSSASATGGNGGGGGIFFGGPFDAGSGGNGGSATASASAKSGSGSATATATATGGAAAGGPEAFPGDATATSTATTNRGGVSVQSTATSGPFEGGPITTLAVAQGGSGQPVPNNLFQTTFAFSTALPDKAYAATLIDGASNVAGALLGLDDTVFGTAILGTQGIGDSASSTFDFRFRGDLLLGLMGEFSISANGDSLADNFVGDDSVINLGSNFGPNIDLTVSGSGVFIVGGSAVPEPSTWAMMVLGFAGLGFAGYRRARPTRALAA